MEAVRKKEEETARSAVFVESKKDDSLLQQKVQGFDFSARRPDGGVDFEALLGSYLTTGFQATSFGKACEEINHMVRERPASSALFRKFCRMYWRFLFNCAKNCLLSELFCALKLTDDRLVECERALLQIFAAFFSPI